MGVVCTDSTSPGGQGGHELAVGASAEPVRCDLRISGPVYKWCNVASRAGIVRRADAWGEIAKEVAWEKGLNLPGIL